MSSFLLDTNIISELRRTKPHGAVLQWISDQSPDSLYICAMTVGELQQGIEALREQDLEKALDIEAWLEKITQSTSLINISARDFRTHAKLMHGKSEACWEDALIAAVAINRQLTIATRNTKDFQQFQVTCVNPFLG